MSQLASITSLEAARAAKAERAEAVVRVDPDPDAIARCGMPGCGEQLYIERTASIAVYLSHTVDDLAEADPNFETWAIVCLAGHKTLLPADGENGAPFGACTCDGDPELLAECGHNDMARLRRVVA